MNLVKAILLKCVSALLFAFLSALVRYAGEEHVPLGQVVFFRSVFAIFPVVLIYAWRNELAAAVLTRRPFGHVGRGRNAERIAQAVADRAELADRGGALRRPAPHLGVGGQELCLDQG